MLAPKNEFSCVEIGGPVDLPSTDFFSFLTSFKPLPSFLVSFCPSYFVFSLSAPVKACLVKWVGTRLSRQITVIGMTVGLHVATQLQPIFCL